MITYSVPAIETVYNGCRFRSRLEARWAAFFDLCGWRWVYEPVDFDGWFPDFALIGDRGNHVYVEVKPISILDDDLAARLEASGCTDEMLVVGLAPFMVGWSSGSLGWLSGEEFNGDRLGGWAEAGLMRPDSRKYSIDFCHSEAGHDGRMSGERGDSLCLDEGYVDSLWSQAIARTQYRKGL